MSEDNNDKGKVKVKVNIPKSEELEEALSSFLKNVEEEALKQEEEKLAKLYVPIASILFQSLVSGNQNIGIVKDGSDTCDISFVCHPSKMKEYLSGTLSESDLLEEVSKKLKDKNLMISGKFWRVEKVQLQKLELKRVWEGSTPVMYLWLAQNELDLTPPEVLDAENKLKSSGITTISRQTLLDLYSSQGVEAIEDVLSVFAEG